MPNKSNMDRKAELEDFLSRSHHYYSSEYEPSYSAFTYNRVSSLFVVLGLSEYKVGDILHPLEAGYAKFWEKRNRAKDHWSKSIRKYVERFFKNFKPRGKK